MAQAIALNAVFNELSQRSARYADRSLDTAERYLRLALRAQGQCRATFETLAVKNPPTVFALDFVAKKENVVVAAHGLGKTMIAKNLVHQATLAGHPARFLSASE